METLIIYEDEGYRKLLPLTYSRPVFDLRCGINTLREKIIREYNPKKISLFCRDYIKDILSYSNNGIKINHFDEKSALVINGRVLANGLKNIIPFDGEDCFYFCNGEIIAARLSNENLKKTASTLKNLRIDKNLNIPSKEISAKIIKYGWDIIQNNPKEIESDFYIINKKDCINGKICENVNLLNRSEIFIDEGTKVFPNVVIDAEEGPIYIGKNVKIMPNSAIIGPVFIGDNSLLKMGSKIYEGTSIGKYCKVADEIENSVIHSYSNKQHLGFLGHSYVGEWVNLAAGTTTSDLKNNYSNVKVFVDGEIIDSGLAWVGSFIGDHSKSGINSMFNAGTVIGFSCNIFGAGFFPKFIASFVWGGTKSFTTYDLEKSIQTAQIIMPRRKVSFSEKDGILFREIFKLAEKERNVFLQEYI
jgi:UDP-N-acetylglucosamine diphosphorylase/glucosamine-1-phosphate N-acetyltransferase